MRAKWVTFTNLPTNKDQKWVQEAIVTSLSYYGDIHDVMVESTDKAKCMRPKTIHVLLDMAPISRIRDQDDKNGVTRVKGKVFLRPKPKWWLPTNSTEILDMKAIQQKMKLRHTEDKARIEGLTNKDESKDHMDPRSPAVVHIDKEPPMEDQTSHLDSSNWVKANTCPKQTKKGAQSKVRRSPTQRSQRMGLNQP
ncbi:hypothetical protein DSO57_1025133 [Entomophthora muscae]|uniref:Uncharacterized protein n=1 Tax=Entomophthora muscae TaxID=34485 RepID=A0ACC2S469_9FUNG|nr:hypothetical protein DSO57_1025133 [Entomophthora muscae]